MKPIACILLNIRPSSIFDAATPQAEQIRALTIGFSVAAAAILLLVVSMTTFIAIKYRRKSDTAEPEQIDGNQRLEFVMIAGPTLLVATFFFWSMTAMNAVMPDPGERSPDVIITGRQWFWQAAYPGTGVVTANEIHLPVGKTILLQLRSGDVIHDWWVPALSGKMDMIPGKNNYLQVTIEKPGIYDGACSEFCGQQHAWMRIRVIAASSADYARWLAGQAAVSLPPKGSLARLGAGIFQTATCGSCHRIAGTAADGTAGPDLTHFASRQTLLTGMIGNDSANLYRWLADPQRVKPGAHMPRYLIAADSLRALTAFLEQLK